MKPDQKIVGLIAALAAVIPFAAFGQQASKEWTGVRNQPAVVLPTMKVTNPFTDIDVEISGDVYGAIEDHVLHWHVGSIKVDNVKPGSPAALAGLKKGVKILSFNGVDLSDVTLKGNTIEDFWRLIAEKSVPPPGGGVVLVIKEGFFSKSESVFIPAKKPEKTQPAVAHNQ